MAARSKKKPNSLAGVLVFLSGIVLGSFVTELTRDFEPLSWLSYGCTFGVGTQNPVVLDLSVVSLTFGLSFHLSIAILLGLCLSFYVWRKWF